jgi:hypothetical protein
MMVIPFRQQSRSNAAFELERRIALSKATASLDLLQVTVDR